MNVFVVILVFLPMILDVVYSDESTREISSVLDLFPEFVQMKDEMNKMKDETNKMKDEVKDEMNKMKDEMNKLKKGSTSSSQCPYAFVQPADHCYKYVAVKATLIEAKMYCIMLGGSLASIGTYKELTVLQDYLLLNKVTDRVWIYRVEFWFYFDEPVGSDGDCWTIQSSIYGSTSAGCYEKYHFICKGP